MDRQIGSYNQPLQHIQSPQHNQHRHQSSFGTESGVPISGGPNMVVTGRDRNDSTVLNEQQFEVARSPPQASSKNTKHVPCKFFRQGACQAGNACPFLHTLDPMSHQAPCKYFMKGNCKFGAKCALAHYLPDGRRVTKADLDPMMGMGRNSYAVNGRNDQHYPTPEPVPQDPFFSAQAYADYSRPQETQFQLEDDADIFDTYRPYRSSTGLEHNQFSPSSSHVGSPSNGNFFSRSPPQAIRSALNAPLPASFNPNDLPNRLKSGLPLGQSVPTRFGDLSSPPANSSYNQKVGSPPSRDPLMRSGSSTLAPSAAPNSMLISASPSRPTNSTLGKPMHSSRAVPKSRMISSSVPVHDLDDEIGASSGFLPSEIHEDVLTPSERSERIRRASRPEPEFPGAKDSQGLAIPRKSSTAVGSPPSSGSPSRFRAIFEQQEREKNDVVSSQLGSPLRESWIPDAIGVPKVGAQMSGLTQQLSRIEIGRSDPSDTTTVNRTQQPSSSAARSGPQSRFDRTISSPGLQSTRIEEEGEGAFFMMDPEDTSKNRTGIWLENSSSSSRKTSSEEGRIPRTVGFGNGARPIFGFQQ